MPGWQQTGVTTADLLRALQESKVDLPVDIISRACAGFSTIQRKYESGRYPDISGHIVGVENGEVAVLVRWMRGAPEAVLVFKKGNVTRKGIRDALNYAATMVRVRRVV